MLDRRECLYPQPERESNAAHKMESPRTKHRLKVPVFTISRNLSQAPPPLHRGINALGKSLPSKKTGFGRGQMLLLMLKNRRHGQKTCVRLTLIQGTFLKGESGFEPGHVRREAKQVR